MLSRLLIFVHVFVLVLVISPYAYIDKIKIFDKVLENEILYSFYYSIEPFDSVNLGIILNYSNVHFTMFSKNFGDFYFLDESKNGLGPVSIYDYFVELGYKNVLFGNFDYYISFIGKYEYYFLFSDIYLGSRLGLGIYLESLYLFGSMSFYDLVYFESLCRYKFGSNVMLELGFSLNYHYKDFFGFFRSVIFEYEGICTSVDSGIYYGSLKGICPFFGLSVSYKNLKVFYGLSFLDSLGTFQFWYFELNM